MAFPCQFLGWLESRFKGQGSIVRVQCSKVIVIVIVIVIVMVMVMVIVMVISSSPVNSQKPKAKSQQPIAKNKKKWAI